jgi:hypothetical protein
MKKVGCHSAGYARDFINSPGFQSGVDGWGSMINPGLQSGGFTGGQQA